MDGSNHPEAWGRGASATDEPGSDFPVRPDGDEEMAESGENRDRMERWGSLIWWWCTRQCTQNE